MKRKHIVDDDDDCPEHSVHPIPCPVAESQTQSPLVSVLVPDMLREIWHQLRAMAVTGTDPVARLALFCWARTCRHFYHAFMVTEGPWRANFAYLALNAGDMRMYNLSDDQIPWRAPYPMIDRLLAMRIAWDSGNPWLWHMIKTDARYREQGLFEMPVVAQRYHTFDWQQWRDMLLDWMMCGDWERLCYALTHKYDNDTPICRAANDILMCLWEAKRHPDWCDPTPLRQWLDTYGDVHECADLIQHILYYCDTNDMVWETPRPSSIYSILGIRFIDIPAKNCSNRFCSIKTAKDVRSCAPVCCYNHRICAWYCSKECEMDDNWRHQAIHHGLV